MSKKAEKQVDMDVDEDFDEEGEESKDEKKEDCSNPDVVTKYRTASDITNQAMQFVIKSIAAGKKIVDICEAGDKFINEAVNKVYNKSKLEKGIGFPTSISVNHVVGHFSPLAIDTHTLAEGDLVKIDLGTHIDGYCAIAAHTLVLPSSKPNQETIAKQANVVAAAYTAAEAAIRLLKIGNKNTQITEAIQKVAADYKVNPVVGVLSHEMSRFVIDGQKVIINKPDAENKVDEITFEPNEVYAIDIVMSTGEGKTKEQSDRTTIFKRSVETHYQLKLKTSRETLSEIDKRFATFPFTLRAFDDKKAKMGIVECLTHGLVDSYPVLADKEGEFVAHFKFTALLLPKQTLRITGPYGIDVSKLPTTLTLKDEGIKKILAEPLAQEQQKKKKKKNTKKKPTTEKKDATPSTSSSSTASKPAPKKTDAMDTA